MGGNLGNLGFIFSVVFFILRNFTEIIKSLRCSLSCSTEMSKTLMSCRVLFSCIVILLLLKNSLMDGVSPNREAIANYKSNGLLNEFVVVLLNFDAGRQWRENSIPAGFFERKSYN